MEPTVPCGKSRPRAETSRREYRCILAVKTAVDQVVASAVAAAEAPEPVKPRQAKLLHVQHTLSGRVGAASAGPKTGIIQSMLDSCPKPPPPPKEDEGPGITVKVGAGSTLDIGYSFKIGAQELPRITDSGDSWIDSKGVNCNEFSMSPSIN